jgi:hypothetical protein
LAQNSIRFLDKASFQNKRKNIFSVPIIHDGRNEKFKSLKEGAFSKHSLMDKHNLQLSISSYPASANQEYGASASYYTTISSHPKFADLNHGESFYISSSII